jgi:tellurite resistance protein TehA-like permease
MVLGPLGQSITAVNLLGAAAAGVTPYAPALRDFGVLYGVAVIGFTLVWLALAAALTIKAHPPFSLAWWSFTFPVGTVVTGTSELARQTHASAFTYLAIALYACLVLAWLTVFPRTVALVSRSCRPSPTRSPATISPRSWPRSRPAISTPPPTR